MSVRIGGQPTQTAGKGLSAGKAGLAPMFQLVLTVPRVLDAVLTRASDIWKETGATVQESLIAAAHEAEAVLTEKPWLMRPTARERLN